MQQLYLTYTITTTTMTMTPPWGGYVNFHIRKQVLLLLRTIRLSR